MECIDLASIREIFYNACNMKELFKKVKWTLRCPSWKKLANMEKFKDLTIIIIIIMSCRQHGYPWPSLATSLYHSSPPAGFLGYILCPHIAAVCKFGSPAFAWPYVGVHRSASITSSSLLLQQCPACLVRLTCIDFVMGGKWPYSWCLVECCRQDLFNIALNILV